jgi:FixJ family two-component response regulator
MPGMSGPELQLELKRQGRDIPIVFITAHTEAAPRLLRRGASACLLKPFSDTGLIAAVNAAIEED